MEYVFKTSCVDLSEVCKKNVKEFLPVIFTKLDERFFVKITWVISAEERSYINRVKQKWLWYGIGNAILFDYK